MEHMFFVQSMIFTAVNTNIGPKQYKH